jgi:hypothetical protein
LPLCSLSSQRMSSCFPSSQLDKQRFKNYFGIILTGTSFEAFDIHSTIVAFFLICHYVSMYDCLYSAGHHSVYRQDAWMVDWHISCYKWLVIPLGIITRSVFLFPNLFLILLDRWPRNASIASILHGFHTAPGQDCHTHSSQSSINFGTIHAFFWPELLQPHKNFLVQCLYLILHMVVIYCNLWLYTAWQ